MIDAVAALTHDDHKMHIGQSTLDLGNDRATGGEFAIEIRAADVGDPRGHIGLAPIQKTRVRDGEVVFGRQPGVQNPGAHAITRARVHGNAPFGKDDCLGGYGATSDGHGVTACVVVNVGAGAAPGAAALRPGRALRNGDVRDGGGRGRSRGRGERQEHEGQRENDRSQNRPHPRRPTRMLTCTANGTRRRFVRSHLVLPRLRLVP
jgi:hypothetical protein